MHMDSGSTAYTVLKPFPPKVRPGLTMRAQVTYLAKLEKLVKEYGQTFPRNEIFYQTGRGFADRSLTYYLDQKLLKSQDETDDDAPLQLTPRGREALSELSRYRVERRIESLSNKRCRINAEIKRLRKRLTS